MLLCTCRCIVSIAMNDGWTVEPLSVNQMIGPSAQTLIAVGTEQTSLIAEKINGRAIKRFLWSKSELIGWNTSCKILWNHTESYPYYCIFGDVSWQRWYAINMP